MANSMYEEGREDFGNADIDYLVDTIKLALLDLGTEDVGIQVITGATNATPIVITATGHTFVNGDIVSIIQVGGNLAANGVFAITGVAANVFSLTDPITGANVVGSGAYTSGGVAVCLGPSAAGSHWDDFDGAVVGTPQTLANKANVNGALDADDALFTAVTGATVEALALYKDTGTPSTSRMIALLDGHQIVTCSAQAAASATTVNVERLAAGIPNGTVLGFSNGASATLSALANAGDRTLTVTALAAIITSGSRADAPATGSGLPVTPNGGNISVAFAALPAGILKL